MPWPWPHNTSSGDGPGSWITAPAPTLAASSFASFGFAVGYFHHSSIHTTTCEPSDPWGACTRNSTWCSWCRICSRLLGGGRGTFRRCCMQGSICNFLWGARMDSHLYSSNEENACIVFAFLDFRLWLQRVLQLCLRVWFLGYHYHSASANLYAFVHRHCALLWPCCLFLFGL